MITTSLKNSLFAVFFIASMCAAQGAHAMMQNNSIDFICSSRNDTPSYHQSILHTLFTKSIVFGGAYFATIGWAIGSRPQKKSDIKAYNTAALKNLLVGFTGGTLLAIECVYALQNLPNSERIRFLAEITSYVGGAAIGYMTSNLYQEESLQREYCHDSHINTYYACA
jgi:hypothetical protein